MLPYGGTNDPVIGRWKIFSTLDSYPKSRGHPLVNPLLPKHPSVILPRLNTIGMVIYFWLIFIYQEYEYWKSYRIVRNVNENLRYFSGHVIVRYLIPS